MNFVDAVKTCLSKYATFSGRASRSEFWWFFLACFIFNIIGSVIDGVLGLGFVGLIISLALFLPQIAVGARRLHDIDKSGWWQLVPFYNLYLWVQPTQPQANRFGEPPVA